jgi:hypothetical protein
MTDYKLEPDKEWCYLASWDDAEDGTEARILHAFTMEDVRPMYGTIRVAGPKLIIFECDKFKMPITSMKQFQVKRKTEVPY